MVDNKKKRTSVRFISPMIILFIGLILLKFDVSIYNLTFHDVTTIGLGLFSIGAFAFVILINDARNKLLTSKDKKTLTYVLVMYASLITILLYENILPVEPLALTVCMIMFIGTIFAIISDTYSLKKYQISSK